MDIECRHAWQYCWQRGGSQMWREKSGLRAQAWLAGSEPPRWRKAPSAMLGMAARKVPGITIITICNRRGREEGSRGEKLSSQLNS